MEVTPPTGWLEYVREGGVVGILIVLVGVLSIIAWRLFLRGEALHAARMDDQAANNKEKVELFTKTLETQNQTSMVIKDNVSLLKSLNERVSNRA